MVWYSFGKVAESAPPISVGNYAKQVHCLRAFIIEVIFVWNKRHFTVEYEAKELSILDIVDCVCIELEVWVQLLSVTQVKLHADSFGSR